jgi:hypothetical protein
MALADDIAAVRNDDTLSDDEKRAAIYQIKVSGILAKIGNFVGNTYSLDGVSYTLMAIRGITENGTLVLEIVVRRVQAPHESVDALRIVNPPIAHNGKACDGMNNQEALAYARHLVSTLPTLGGGG